MCPMLSNLVFPPSLAHWQPTAYFVNVLVDLVVFAGRVFVINLFVLVDFFLFYDRRKATTLAN